MAENISVPSSGAATKGNHPAKAGRLGKAEEGEAEERGRDEGSPAAQSGGESPPDNHPATSGDEKHISLQGERSGKRFVRQGNFTKSCN